MSSFASVDSEEVGHLETLGSADAPTKCGRLQGAAPRRGTGNSVSRSAFNLRGRPQRIALVKADEPDRLSPPARIPTTFPAG
jgi:hypothetical protein